VNRILTVTALALASLASLPARADCRALKVENAWIPEAPPVAPVLAGYARLKNESAHALRIDSVDGADFDSVELHQMRMENGMMQMRPLKGLEIPAHGLVVLADGDKHLMLMNPHHPFKAGDSTMLRFHCGKASSEAVFTVQEPRQ
jgi:copper(I)-binding protein